MRLKMLLISKNYFENWLSAGFKCFLYRRGLLRTNTLSVRCRDSASLTLPPRLYELLLSGLLSELFRGLSCRNQVAVAASSLIPLQELLMSEEVLGALRSGWKYSMNYGVWVSLGLILLVIKPSTLGFTALGIPFHRDPYHRAPPALGNPSPQLTLHCFLWVIAVGKPPHPGFLPQNTPLLGL